MNLLLTLSLPLQLAIIWDLIPPSRSNKPEKDKLSAEEKLSATAEVSGGDNTLHPLQRVFEFEIPFSPRNLLSPSPWHR